jgi:large subunit ribosomal protein L34
LHFTFSAEYNVSRSQEEDCSVKRPYQPNVRHRMKTHGFRKRMKNNDGRNVLKRRRLKGRVRLVVTETN